MSLTKKVSLSGGIIIALALGSVLMWSIALAQNETTTTTSDISPELVPLAQELGCQTTLECAEKFDANLENGITLAQKYDIYTPEQEKIASTFKTEVLERLKTVSQDDFEEEILALANKILKEKPALAKTMGVTKQDINFAQTIITTVKDSGTDIRTCQKSPEDLSREQLIACVKASNNLSSKEKVAGDYIPKENAKAGEMKRMLDLEDSLLSGEYPGLGKIGVEQAGQICLKPDSKAITDCDRIAERFFGAEGVRELEKARTETTRIEEYYVQGIEKMELLTPDGQKLIGKGAIRNACDRAFNESNLGLARACGNFAVKNGFATEEEIEEGLKLLETFTEKAGGVDFDDCRFDPASCREFLPDDFRSQFDSEFEIFKIMSESIGFDPMRCEDSYDADIGKQCLEGARKALPRIEEIAKNSPGARRIVDEIRFHINEGERMTKKLDEFHEDSSSGRNAGPGGCRGPEECYKYCSQPSNSAECISFGAKSQIFEQNTVVEKFNFVNRQFDTPEGFDYRPFPNQSDQGQQGFNQYPDQPQRPSGPSPECFAAISSGDFAKAKAVCSNTTNTYERNYPQPIQPPFPVCPAYSIPSPCPEGQMRQNATDGRGCPTYGACTPIENYKPIDFNPKPCPMMATVSSCSAGQEMYITYESNECGKYYGCKSSTVPVAEKCPEPNQYRDPEKNICITQTPCPSGQYWDYMTDACSTQTVTKECSSGMWWDGATKSCKSTADSTMNSCDFSTQYWKSSTNTCQPRTNCYSTTNPDYNSMECQGVRGSTQPVASGCGSFTTEATCQTNSGCGWANGACGGNMTTGGYGCGGATSMTSCSSMPGCSWQNNACMPTSTYVNTGSCPSGYHSHSDSGGYCMNDQENYSGTCYNSAGTSTIACPQMTYTSSCPSGQYWYTPSGGGAGYCMSSSTTSCSSGQYWNGSACVSNTTTSCSSGQYWYTPSSGGTGYCMTSSTTSCSSSQYWNGTACVENSSTYTTDPSAACAQGGGTWNSSTSYCQMPTTTSSTSCGSGQYWNGSSCVSSSTTSSSTSCGSGQWWDGTACQNVTTPSSTCSSGQYWDGTACVSSSSTTSSSSSCGSGQWWDGTACQNISTPSSSSTDPSAACTQAGGSWSNGTCTMPTSMVLCNQAGGNWTGAACNLATNISNQKAYNNYFDKSSDSLLAQVIGGFFNLFK